MGCTETKTIPTPCRQDSMVLVYGMTCPCRCDFCCHSVEQYGPVRMEAQQAIDWIGQAREIPSIGLLVFTGGEPFVYYRDLLQILEQASPSDRDVRIVTSAHWATSPQEALARLQPLTARGLTQLSISTDPTHQQFVPRAHAEYAARAALELGLLTELAGVFWDPDTKVEDMVDVPEGAITYNTLAIPVGPGPHEPVSATTYRLGPERFFGCGDPQSLSLTVYPDGLVYPCCSGGFNIRGKLDFGNLNHDPLQQILDRARTDPFVRVVTGLGIACLYELVQFRWPQLRERLPDLQGHISPCEVCAHLHADEALLEALRPVLEYANQLHETVKTLDVDGSRKKPEVLRA